MANLLMKTLVLSFTCLACAKHLKEQKNIVDENINIHEFGGPVLDLYNIQKQYKKKNPNVKKETPLIQNQIQGESGHKFLTKTEQKGSKEDQEKIEEEQTQFRVLESFEDFQEKFVPKNEQRGPSSDSQVHYHKYLQKGHPQQEKKSGNSNMEIEEPSKIHIITDHETRGPQKSYEQYIQKQKKQTRALESFEDFEQSFVPKKEQRGPAVPELREPSLSEYEDIGPLSKIGVKDPIQIESEIQSPILQQQEVRGPKQIKSKEHAPALNQVLGEQSILTQDKQKIKTRALTEELDSNLTFFEDFITLPEGEGSVLIQASQEDTVETAQDPMAPYMLSKVNDENLTSHEYNVPVLTSTEIRGPTLKDVRDYNLHRTDENSQNFLFQDVVSPILAKQNQEQNYAYGPQAQKVKASAQLIQQEESKGFLPKDEIIGQNLNEEVLETYFTPLNDTYDAFEY